MRALRLRWSGGWAWAGMAAVLALGVGLAGVAVGSGPKSKGAKAAPEGEKTSRSALIDEALREAWANASIRPSAVAPDAEFLRRAYLDVLGRIPNIPEALAFLENKEKNKRAKLVEYLLVQPDYAKNFSNVWTTLLVGRKPQERGVDRQALAAWLRKQFGENRPWNAVAYDLIAAKGSNKENGAVNYTMAHLEFGDVPLTSITTRVFLGQQIQCTQCHDHPSNDWKQGDFWGINAFFKGVRAHPVRTANAAGTEVVDHYELEDEPTEAFASYDRRNGLVGVAFPTFLDGRKIPQGRDVDRREALAKFVTAEDNLDFARAFVNRMWAHFLGRGFVNPVDDFGPHNPPTNPELLDGLAKDFQANHFDVKELVRAIMLSQAYNLTSATTRDNEKDETLFSHVGLKPMTPEQLFDSLIVATSAHKAGGGDTQKRRDDWMKQFVTTFANDEGEEATNFQGTIPQALMMMNGPLMEQAVSCRPGSFLYSLLDQARMQARMAPEIFVVNRMYLAALSRFPTQRELAKTRDFLSIGVTPNDNEVHVMEDMFWALLNSNEFILNR